MLTETPLQLLVKDNLLFVIIDLLILNNQYRLQIIVTFPQRFLKILMSLEALCQRFRLDYLLDTND